MYLVFRGIPGESYRKRLRSLLLYLCDVFRALINSLVCWFWSIDNSLILSLSSSFSLSLCCCVCHQEHICKKADLCLNLYPCVSVCLCLSVCLSLSVSVCLSVCLSVCVCVCLSLSPSLSLSLSLSLSATKNKNKAEFERSRFSKLKPHDPSSLGRPRKRWWGTNVTWRTAARCLWRRRVRWRPPKA